MKKEPVAVTELTEEEAQAYLKSKASKRLIDESIEPVLQSTDESNGSVKQSIHESIEPVLQLTDKTSKPSNQPITEPKKTSKRSTLKPKEPSKRQRIE